jgi:tetratricopeptide (TPR) repeat protein
MQSDKKTHLLFIFIIVVLAVIVYANTLRNGFVYDDSWEIVDNNWIRHFSSLFSECHRYRLTETFTLFVDYKLWGLNPSGFHLTSLLFHILTSVAVYALVYSILKEKWSAFFTGFLFVTYPVHTEAVSIISHRQEILAMLFMLLGLIFYIKQKGRTSHWSLAISMIFFACALGAKEAAFIFPFLLLLYDLYFDKTRIKFKHYLPYILLLGLFLIVFSIPSPRWNFKISGFDTVSFGHSLSGNRPYYSIILTQLKGFSQYIKLSIFPHPLNIDYYFPVYTSLFQDSIYLSLLLLLLIIFLCIITYQKYKIISFGIAWFLINLLPVSNILPKTFFVAERYLYIPSFGFCLILAWILAKGLNKKRTRIISIVVLGLIIIFYSIRAIQRNFDFKSDYTLWSQTIKDNPKSVHGHNNVGIGLLESGKTEQAIKEFELAIQLAPTFAKPYYNLGIVCEKLGNYEKAIDNLNTSLKLDVNLAESHAALGTIYQKLGKYDLVIENLEKAVLDSKLSDDASLHYTLGTGYRDAGRYDKAQNQFKKAINLYPKYGEAHNDLGIELGRIGQYDEAIKELTAAISLISNPAQAYYNLATVYIKKGEYQNAINALKNCLKTWTGDKTTIRKMINELIKENA